MSGVLQRLKSGILGQSPSDYQLEYACNIGGWSTYYELLWLAKQARQHYRILEIGAYMGRSTRALADNTPGFVAAVDDFKGPRDIRLPTFLRDNLFEMFVSSTSDLLQSGKVRPIVADHGEFSIDFTPDMIFIDGSHEYEDVKRDILNWGTKMKHGDLLCGHDYTNMDTVRKAVHDTLNHFDLVEGTSLWYCIV